VICNAGIVEPRAALDTTPDMWRRTLEVHLSGPL
jgi:NAD(P)-dependent dehydrogenase (short-subunit alcohol dehydrogenase family)